MTYMVIGGTGFLGSHVVKELLDRQRKVIVLDVVPNREALDVVVGEQAEEVTVLPGDVTDLHSLLHAVADYGVTHLIHTAAVLAAVCNENPPVAVNVNIGGLVNTLETCRLAGIKKLVWASSGGVFGGGYPEDVLIRNDSPRIPNGVYGATKAFGEHLTEHYFRAFGVDSVGIRFGLINGLGKQRGVNAQLSRELIEKPAVGEAGTVPWSDDKVNWLWVGDAARAVAMALDAPTTSSRNFNIGGDYRPIREVAAWVRRLLPGVQYTFLPGRRGFAHWIDSAAIEDELGFQATWTMEQQVLEMINTLRRRRGLEEVRADGKS